MPTPSDSLPLSKKLIYGAKTLAGEALALPIFVFMPKFYSDVVGAPLAYIAMAIVVARSFDAITDPLMGWISDRTHTRWGRRRPWMALGSPLCAVCAIALFAPPQGLAPNAAALWFALAFGLYFLFHTIYVIPYTALGAELTLDYHERSRLFAWRTMFMLVGQALAGVLYTVLPPLVGGERAGFVVTGTIYAGLLISLMAILVVRVRERPDFVERESNPLVPGVRRALRNRPFRILLFSYCVGNITAAVPATLAPFFIAYVLLPENPEFITGIAILVYLGSGVASIPLWLAATRRVGKRLVWLWSFWIGMAASVGMFMLGPGDTPWFLALILVTGTGNGAALLHPSMQADIIDYDELHTGRRREAQFASFWAIVPKFIAIPSAAVPLVVLAQLGYVPNQEQTPEVVFAMRAIFLVPAAINVLAWMIALRFPLTEVVHREILAGIAAQRRGESARDPLTGALLPPTKERAVPEATSWRLDTFSPGELRRVLRRGARGLLVDVSAAAGLSLAVCVVAAGWVIVRVCDLAQPPDVWVTLAVVISGLAASGFLFHALRLRPARRMQSDPVAQEALSLHLDELRAGSEPAPDLAAGS